MFNRENCLIKVVLRRRKTFARVFLPSIFIILSALALVLVLDVVGIVRLLKKEAEFRTYVISESIEKDILRTVGRGTGDYVIKDGVIYFPDADISYSFHSTMEDIDQVLTGEEVCIFDNDGRMLFGCSHQSLSEINRADFFWKDGEYHLSRNFSPLPDISWTIIYTIPLVKIVEASTKTVYAFLLLFIVLSFVSLWVSMRTVNSLDRLKKAEEKARLNAEQLDMFISNAPNAMRIISSDYITIKANTSFAEMCELDLKEIIGKPCYETTPTDFCRSERCPLVMISNGTERYEREIDFSAGERKIPSIKSAAGFRSSESGEVLGIIESTKDISEIKNQQKQMESLMDLLMKSNDSLENANADMQKSNREMEEFIQIISHDLREPLRAVSSYMELAKKRYGDMFPDEALEFMNFAIGGARQMEGLISDLLTYSRVGSTGRQFEETDLDDIWDLVVSKLRLNISSRNALVETEPLPSLQVDRVQMIQLFQNLVANSLKYNDSERPHIRLTTSFNQGEYVFRLTDNGPGIEPAYRERVFTLFQKLEREVEGRGLGLALSRKIVERHGGRIWIEDNPNGRGAVFAFTIKDWNNAGFVAA